MRTAPNMTTAHRRWRWLHTITATAATMTMMTLAACSDPSEGIITDTPSPTPTSSESQISELVFALDIPEDICPTAEVIPEEFAAPESIGYIDESGPDMSGTIPYHRCGYLLDNETAVLDGTQAIERVYVDFHIADESPRSVRSHQDYSAVNFDQIRAAHYFHDWDQALDKYEHDPSPAGYGLEESGFVTFQSFASIDNLYIYTYVSFVVTDENYDTEPDLDIDTAAYQTIEAIVAPVVADLERQ